MFNLSKSQREIQQAAREFARGKFDKETVWELEKNRCFPQAQYQKAAELGFIGIHLPEEFDGGGLGLLEACLTAETLCRQDSTLGTALMLGTHGAECLARFGAETLKRKYLTPVARGEMLAAAAFIESERGDLTSEVSATAEQDGAFLRVQGNKRYVINGGMAGFYLVLCRTRADNIGKDACSVIVVPADAPGITVKPINYRLGWNMTALADISFEQVKVPTENIVGTQGKGMEQVRAFLDETRILLSARSVGIGAGALDRALSYIKQREQFGRRLAEFQIIRHKIADMAVKVELARLITQKAAQTADSGTLDSSLASMAKITASRLAVEIADQAIQIFGGYGYMAEQEVERFFRDAKTAELTLGAPEAQKDQIADNFIGRLK